jgi:hypothetical protein
VTSARIILVVSPRLVHADANRRECGAACTYGEPVAIRPKKTVRTSVILPEQAHARIAALAAANDVSAAWVVRHAVLRFLEEQGDQAELPLRRPRARTTSA